MPDDSVGASAGGLAGARKGCAPNAPALAASVATPPSAAPLRKFRRSTAFLDLSMASHQPPGGVSVATYEPSYASCQCFILAQKRCTNTPRHPSENVSANGEHS